jgi:hypothetical protein
VLREQPHGFTEVFGHSARRGGSVLFPPLRLLSNLSRGPLRNQDFPRHDQVR